jgi:predicted nucleotidyltransferase
LTLGRGGRTLLEKGVTMDTGIHIHHGISFDSALLEIFCRENGIKKLSLFGSILREDFGPESDLDMLVEFIPGKTVTYIHLSQLERALSEIFAKKIDLRTPGELSGCFREKVTREAEELYVR